MTSEALCLHLLPCLFDGQGFAPDGRVTFSLLADRRPVQRESNQRESTPRIRPRLRRGSLVPSLLQGRAPKGRPCPFGALAASMPLDPLRIDSTRPPEGPRFAAPAHVGTRAFRGGIGFLFFRRRRCQATHESPSGGRAQALCRGTRGMDAERGAKDGAAQAGRPFAACPRSSAGAREVWPRSGQTRMLGCPSSCLLLLGGSAPRQARRSKAPGGAQPEGAASTAKSALARRIKP